MESLVIKIDWIYFLGLMGSLIGIAWYSSARFTKAETLLEGVDKRLTSIEGRNNGAFQSQSPISLTVKGENLLKESGLKTFIDNEKTSLTEKCSKDNNMTSAYDVQNCAFSFFDSMEFESVFEKKLKDYAYHEGIDMKVLRRVGGIYFRNIILEKLGMKQEDIESTQL